MEKKVEDLDILLSRMDIFVSEIKDTASDMVELMNIVGVVPKNILQIRALVKENSGKTNIPSCSSDEQMIDLVSEKDETIKVKETYSFRPQTDKTLSFEKIIQNLIVQDPVEIQILTMKELYSLPSTEAMSRLDEALSINPAKHAARWCLGNAYTTNAFLTSNHDEAKILFDEAF
ncbi:mitochondrial import receptor subunit TOM20-like protein [Tanacetum coccineum]